MNCSKTVFLTGGTGLIGKELLTPLLEAGFSVYALTIDEKQPAVSGVNWIKGNLFDDVFIRQTMEQIRPSHLLNMAWCANGDYAVSKFNFSFVRAGLTLLEAFAQYGGKRAVFAGSYMEYAPKNGAIKENDPLLPDTCYSACKNALREMAEMFCAHNGISFAWGRIFCVYGHGEHPKRLTASIMNALKAGEPVRVRFSQLQRDYIYSKDVAGAFVRLLEADTKGSVNVCSGRTIRLGDYARTVAALLGREDLLVLAEEPSSQPDIVLGDNSRLSKEVGFSPRYTLEKGLKQIIEDLR